MANLTPAQVLSLLPGRARIHLPAWSGNNPDRVETRLQSMKGLREARANPLTGNILVRFDPSALTADRLLCELSRLAADDVPADKPGKQVPQSGKSVVARAVVKGTLGHAAVDTLFYTGAAAATALGWTWAAPLAAAHLVIDVFVWGLVLRPVVQHFTQSPGDSDLPDGRPQKHGTPLADPER